MPMMLCGLLSNLLCEGVYICMEGMHKISMEGIYICTEEVYICTESVFISAEVV
jgi:hypothetical protein